MDELLEAKDADGEEMTRKGRAFAVLSHPDLGQERSSRSLAAGGAGGHLQPECAPRGEPCGVAERVMGEEPRGEGFEVGGGRGQGAFKVGRW